MSSWVPTHWKPMGRELLLCRSTPSFPLGQSEGEMGQFALPKVTADLR